MTHNLFKALKTGVELLEYLANEDQIETCDNGLDGDDKNNSSEDFTQLEVKEEGIRLNNGINVLPGELVFVEVKLLQSEIKNISERFNITKMPEGFLKYRHFGIYAGEGNIIHFVPVQNNNARIKKVSIREFQAGILPDIIKGCWSAVNLDVAPMTNLVCETERELRHHTLKQAKMWCEMHEVLCQCDEMLDDDIALVANTKYEKENFDSTQPFHILYNNSEHFARWCATQEKISLQAPNEEAEWTEGKKILFNKIEFIGRFIRRFDDNENFLDDWLKALIN